MDEHMGGEGGGAFELLVAFLTFEYFLVTVNGFVLFQANGVSESLFA